MPRLSHDKQEKFATYIVAGYTQMAAYQAAGYSCKNSSAAANASKLMSDETVAARIEELKAKAAEKLLTTYTAPPLPVKKENGHGEIDLSWINNEYIQLLNTAKENNDIKNAVTILKDMAELNKVRPEKTEEEKNRMLPSNDKQPQLGNQTYVQIINQKSEENGRGIDGLVAINLPDAEPIFTGNYPTDEDDST